MFVVLLEFSDNQPQAGQFIDGHNAWLKRGLDDDVFLLAGSLQPNRGGALFAYNTTREALQERVDEDPFVAENVVTAEILEITPSKTAPLLDCLLDAPA